MMVLEDIRSLYNVGSIFRSADAFLMNELVLTGYTPTPPRKEIAKTALGADATVPWRSVSDQEDRSQNAVQVIQDLKAGGWNVFALEITTKPKPLNQISQDMYPLCIVVGNELTGVSPEALSVCDGALEIGMFGVKHSLNVAVAAGIAMYEAVRQQP